MPFRVSSLLIVSSSYPVAILWSGDSTSTAETVLMAFMQTMLIKYEVFSEDVTRFYMAECCLAIEAVHNLGFIHRYVPLHWY